MNKRYQGSTGICFLACVAFAQSASAQLTFDLAADFSASQNPHGAWALGWMAPGSTEADEARLLDLERRGLLKRGTGKLPKDFWTRPLPKLKGSLVEALLKEREEAPW